MKAMVFEVFGGLDQMKWTEVATPQPTENEILVEVSYAGVNPVDWKIGAGYLKKRIPHVFPLIPGWDVAGKLVDCGRNVTRFKKGDLVCSYCRKPTVQWGTYAEYVCIPQEMAAAVPQNITLSQAAAIPLVTLTAWQALHDVARVQKGQTVLIHAGAGGVGGMAVQLAKYAGATVLSTTSAKNHDYVRKLGVSFPIDYTRKDFRATVSERYPQGVDVVIDCVGADVLAKSYEIVKKEGHLVGIVNFPDADLAAKHHIQVGFVFVEPKGDQLTEIMQLLAKDVIQPPEILEFPLSEAKKALEQIKTEHTRGKIVLRVR